LLTRRDLRHATLAGRNEILRLTDVFVAGLRQGGPVAAANGPAARLLGDLLDRVDANRILIIPDGPLNGLPFAALPLHDDSSGQILVERFVLGYAPSLALAMRRSGPQNTANRRFAVVSDPVYAPDDRRLAASIAASGNLRGIPQLSPNKLTRLHYSAMEARAVVRALGDDTIQLSGFDATPSRVLALKSSELAVLHFATHAVARADSPEQSALFLSEYSPEGALLEDSNLSVAEITRAGLRADVVVLSGCETGDGSRLRGEGVLGLTYGFLANGSQAVVAALWPIEDAATAKFMNEFYGAYHKTGQTAVALRQAQLGTRGSIKAAVWSSFVVRANEFP
jgi:CHAT domain-containing protein